jgi:hypothetical protein
MNNVTDRLNGPAVSLIISGTLNAILGMFIILGQLVALTKEPSGRVFSSEERRLGYMVGSIVWPTLGLIAILVSPLIIYGAFQMLQARKYSMAKLAAILSLIPFTSSCCVLSIPAGIWALMILSKPEVKMIFYRAQSETPSKY